MHDGLAGWNQVYDGRHREERWSGNSFKNRKVKKGRRTCVENWGENEGLPPGAQTGYRGDNLPPPLPPVDGVIREFIGQTWVEKGRRLGIQHGPEQIVRPARKVYGEILLTKTGRYQSKSSSRFSIWKEGQKDHSISCLSKICKSFLPRGKRKIL